MIGIFGPYSSEVNDDFVENLKNHPFFFEKEVRPPEREEGDDVISRKLTIAILNLVARNLDEPGKQVGKQFIDIIKEIPSANGGRQ